MDDQCYEKQILRDEGQIQYFFTEKNMHYAGYCLLQGAVCALIEC